MKAVYRHACRLHDSLGVSEIVYMHEQPLVHVEASCTDSCMHVKTLYSSNKQLPCIHETSSIICCLYRHATLNRLSCMPLILPPKLMKHKKSDVLWSMQLEQYTILNSEGVKIVAQSFAETWKEVEDNNYYEWRPRKLHENNLVEVAYLM